MASPGQKPLEKPREEAFARHYSRHGNGQRAIVAAGYKAKTWAEGSTSASAWASTLLKKEHIRRRIQYMQENRARAADVTEIKLLRELKRISFFDIRNLYDEGGNIKKPREWDDATAAAVSSVEVEKLFGDDGSGKRSHIGYTVKVKTAAKLEAIEKLMRYHGMLESVSEDPNHTTVNVDNRQVKIYLPENPRHAKIQTPSTIERDAEEDDTEEPGQPPAIILPAKLNGNGRH